MKRVRAAIAAAMVLGCMSIAPSAAADENCVGAEGVVVVCVEPTGRLIYDTCIYTGGDTCEPVAVWGPDVTRCSIGEDGGLMLCQII